jgi:hypothetical protein
VYHSEGGVGEDQLKAVTGEVIMAESKPHITPLRTYPVPTVNETSKRLCQVRVCVVMQ